MSKVQKIECTATHTIQEGRLHIDCTGLSDCSLTITQKVGNADFVQGKDFGINLDHLLKCSWDFLISAPKHYTVVAPGELKRFSRPNDDLFHYKQSIPISLSSVQIIRGALECIRLFNQKPSKDDGEDQIADQSKIDVFFMPKDRKFIQSSCFYLPQV